MKLINRDIAIKVIVVSQTTKLNGKTHALIDEPIGTIIDACPIYGDIHNTIIGYYVENDVENSYVGWVRRLPSELFKPVAKHRQEQIDSIFED